MRHGHKERAAVKAGLRLCAPISPPPHGSGFIINSAALLLFFRTQTQHDAVCCLQLHRLSVLILS